MKHLGAPGGSGPVRKNLIDRLHERSMGPRESRLLSWLQAAGFEKRWAALFHRLDNLAHFSIANVSLTLAPSIEQRAGLDLSALVLIEPPEEDEGDELHWLGTLDRSSRSDRPQERESREGRPAQTQRDGSHRDSALRSPRDLHANAPTNRTLYLERVRREVVRIESLLIRWLPALAQQQLHRRRPFDVARPSQLPGVESPLPRPTTATRTTGRARLTGPQSVTPWLPRRPSERLDASRYPPPSFGHGEARLLTIRTDTPAITQITAAVSNGLRHPLASTGRDDRFRNAEIGPSEVQAERTAFASGPETFAAIIVATGSRETSQQRGRAFTSGMTLRGRWEPDRPVAFPSGHEQSVIHSILLFDESSTEFIDATATPIAGHPSTSTSLQSPPVPPPHGSQLPLRHHALRARTVPSSRLRLHRGDVATTVPLRTFSPAPHTSFPREMRQLRIVQSRPPPHPSLQVRLPHAVIERSAPHTYRAIGRSTAPSVTSWLPALTRRLARLNSAQAPLLRPQASLFRELSVPALTTGTLTLTPSTFLHLSTMGPTREAITTVLERVVKESIQVVRVDSVAASANPPRLLSKPIVERTLLVQIRSPDALDGVTSRQAEHPKADQTSSHRRMAERLKRDWGRGLLTQPFQSRRPTDSPPVLSISLTKQGFPTSTTTTPVQRLLSEDDFAFAQIRPVLREASSLAFPADRDIDVLSSDFTSPPHPIITALADFEPKPTFREHFANVSLSQLTEKRPRERVIPAELAVHVHRRIEIPSVAREQRKQRERQVLRGSATRLPISPVFVATPVEQLRTMIPAVTPTSPPRIQKQQTIGPLETKRSHRALHERRWSAPATLDFVEGVEGAASEQRHSVPQAPRGEQHALSFTLVSPPAPEPPPVESQLRQDEPIRLRRRNEGGAFAERPERGRPNGSTAPDGSLDVLAQRVYQRLSRRLRLDRKRLGL